MSEEPAKTTSEVPHTVDATVEGVTAEHATKEPTKEGAGTDHGAAEKGNEPAATETHVSSVARQPSSEHTVSEKDAKHKASGLEHAPAVVGERRPNRKSSAEGAKPTSHASTEHVSNALSPEHASSEVGDKQLSRMSSAESAAPKSIGHASAHAGANRAKANAKRTRSEVDTDRSGSKTDTDRSGSKVGATRSVEHVKIEPTTGPVTERSKIEPNTTADESSKAGRRAVLRMATREVTTPGTGRIIELVAFAVIVAVIVMIGAAIFNAAYGRDPKDARIRGGDDLLGTAIYRGHRSWHGYGPQLLVCVLGERRSVVAPESLPPDGLCDVVLYAHVSSLGPEFQAGASENLRALWTRAATAVHTRFGYSFSDSLLPVDEQDLESFVRRAVDEKKIGAFGMLDARWERHVGDNEAYVSFVASLNRTTKKLPNDHRAALVFGFRVDPATSSRGIEFSNSHAAILDHVHVLVYQGHVELPRQNDSAESPCAVRFPSPRFQQAVDSDQTMQDGVAAIDTALHIRTRRLATDICVSVSLSGHRYSLTKAAADGAELKASCAGATAVPYADVCPSYGTSGGVKISGEGALVNRKQELVLDVFDDSETLAQKLRTAKLALSLSAQPHWSFCLAAFNLEHEDSDGACGESFERLTVARSFLHGKLRWHDD